MKAHVLSRLLSSLYNTPHLVDSKTFNIAIDYLNARNKFGMMDMSPTDDDSADDDEDFDPLSGVGVICVSGPLTYKPVMTACGPADGGSYQDILEDAEEMIESGCTTLILDMDSGGGEAYGCFETASELRKMCDDAGVRLYAYNDGCIASACYGLAVVADEVISNPYAETGSIGVLIALINDSKALEQQGYTRTFISAGDEKIPFAEDGSWREGFLESLQVKVNSLYDMFVSHVATYTGLSAEVIKNTEAKMFSAEEALSIGLINKIMTRSEFADYIANKQKESM